MQMESRINNSGGRFLLLPFLVIAALVCVMVFCVFTDWLTLSLMSIAGALFGFVLGCSLAKNRHLSSPCDSEPSIAVAGADNNVESADRVALAGEDYRPDYLRAVVDELSLMQGSEDLYNRYQCFVRVAESGLGYVLGRCVVSLWFPDSRMENLIECVIRTSDVSAGSFLSDECNHRQPCCVPLDSSVIKRAIETGQAQLADRSVVPTIDRSVCSGSLRSDGCIPLYRTHGRPLLVNIERLEAVSSSGDRRYRHQADSFRAVTELIKLFWHQLQATNERQWMVDHDHASGALRDTTFISQAQSYAVRACREDELFSVVVVAIHGFRSTFAGQSHQWRDLSGLLGRSLSGIISEKNPGALLGKMADDVFAIMLPRTDHFLAVSVMKRIFERLEAELTKADGLGGLADIMAIDIQFSCADYRDYSGDIEEMLNIIYSKMFAKSSGDSPRTHRIVVGELLST